jgi:hypothetical protein
MIVVEIQRCPINELVFWVSPIQWDTLDYGYKTMARVEYGYNFPNGNRFHSWGIGRKFTPYDTPIGNRESCMELICVQINHDHRQCLDQLNNDPYVSHIKSEGFCDFVKDGIAVAIKITYKPKE